MGKITNNYIKLYIHLACCVPRIFSTLFLQYFVIFAKVIFGTPIFIGFLGIFGDFGDFWWFWCFSLYGPIPVKTETFRELSGPLVHTNFGGNWYGPIIGPYLFLGKFVWTNSSESSSKVSPYTGIGPWMALPSNYTNYIFRVGNFMIFWWIFPQVWGGGVREGNSVIFPLFSGLPISGASLAPWSKSKV